MHIKPPSLQAAKAAAQPQQTAKAAAGGKSGDFAQMLKAQQAETPAAPPSPTPAPTRS